VLDVSLFVAKNTDGTHVAWCLYQHGVSLVEEEIRQQFKRVLATGGNHQILNRALNALKGHDFLDLLAQPQVTLAAAILQGVVAAIGHQGSESLLNKFAI
jgi:hypothetical protein